MPYGFLFSVFRPLSSWDVAVLGIDFRAVRTMVSMTDVLQLIGYPMPTASANTLRGPCPIHQSRSQKSRSFAVHVGRKMYRCFGCGSAGNHLDLYAAVTRQAVYQAAVDLCDKMQREVPWLHPRG